MIALPTNHSPAVGGSGDRLAARAIADAGPRGGTRGWTGRVRKSSTEGIAGLYDGFRDATAETLQTSQNCVAERRLTGL